MSNKIKQVIVMRHDLGMRRGKQIAQGAHASLAFLSKRVRAGLANGNKVEVEVSSVEAQWLSSSFAKVCVRANSEEELWDIYKKAQSAGLEVHLVTDSGKTEFHGVATDTCLAIGPDLSEKIDPITGHLELL